MSVTLRPFFALLARHGEGTVSEQELARAAAACGHDAYDALRAEGIVLPAPLATTWPCEGLTCARVVGARGEGFVAGCAEAPPRCETVTLARADLAQVRLSLAAVHAVALRELGIASPSSPRRGARTAEPSYLGEQGVKSPRDVFFALRPRDTDLALFLAAREHAPRPTLLLVAELGAIAHEVVVAHAAGAKVEIDELAAALATRDGAIIAIRRLRATPKPQATADAITVGAHDVGPTLGPAVRRWEDLRIRAFKDGTVSVKVGLCAQRLTHVDLGMAHKQTRKPLRHSELLLAVCRGGGPFRWKELGKFVVVKKVVSELRGALCRAFLIDEDPFYDFSYAHQWKAKFQCGVGEDDGRRRGSRVDGEEDEALGRAWGTTFEQWDGERGGGTRGR